MPHKKNPDVFESHPVWVRGLKQSRYNQSVHPLKVAPRVGAWIETYSIALALGTCIVAPRVGAWIET